MRSINLLAIAALATLAADASAQEADWKKVDEVLGRTATVSGDVHRYGFPRTDLQVTLDGVTIRPALALGGWKREHTMRHVQHARAATERRRSCGS
jgi:hypothetical protein